MEQLITGLIFVALGAVFLLVAAIAWFRTRHFVGEALPAFGEVIALREHSGDGVTYSPVVRFQTREGRPVEFTETTSSNPPGYAVGERIEVLYHWRDPSRARVASTFRLYLLAMIFGGLGVIFLAVGSLVAAFAGG
jgi:hypothetical protein